ncbi:MAG: carboxypeptidase-like regulatory domain-containing protein [Acidobacteriota bacterium]
MPLKTDNSTALWVAAIGAIAIISAAMIAKCGTTQPSIKTSPTPTSSPVIETTPSLTEGRLVGMLTDRASSPLSNMTVSIRNGPTTKTDSEGRFVLNNVATGDQLLEVQASTGGRLTQNVALESKKTTTANFVYDASTSRLGLLSIVGPVDGGLLELTKDGTEHRAVVYGRCDSLSQILGSFDVWVLISSQRDSRFWVQQPPAVIDPSTNTWRARALFGSTEHPPKDGEQWDILAVSASSDSEFKRILNTPMLSMLPPHISSNVVTVEIRIIRQQVSQPKL